MSVAAPHNLLVRSRLLLGASFAALMIATPAYAQDASSPAPPPATDDVTPPTDDQAEANAADQGPPESAPADTETGDAIVVTGSRIRQAEFTSPDPVTSIDPEMAIRQGQSSTAEMLQSSPVAAGSTQITSAISSNFVTNGGPGSQTINLRGLGANRTLVLLNGRRAGPAGVRGGVSSFDLNVLPQSIVQRVEILKTGASSIYGSDAIAGVVNLMTKNQLDGFQIDANNSTPFRSGGEQYRISALWGNRFDRGHFMIAGDFFKQPELARGDRGYLGCPEANIFRRNGERADLVDPRTGQFKCEDLRWGHVWTYDLENIFGIGPGNLFNTNGQYTGSVNLLQFEYPGENLGIPIIDPNAGLVAPLRSPGGWFPTGYDAPSLAVQNAYHPFVNEQTLTPKTQRITLYGDAAYELTDDVELFAEFLGNRRKTYQNSWRQFWTFGYTGDIYGEGAGGPGTFWADGWTGYNWLSPTGITNQADSSQRVDYLRGVGGFRGDFDLGFLKGWSFDTYVQYSRSKGVYRDQQILQDVYDISYFQTASCVGTMTPVSGKQCIDLPWLDPNFLAGQMTQEQMDFLFSWEEGRTKYNQLSFEGSITGNLFELPAGPVGAAFGVTARRDTIHDRPGEITLAGNAWGSTASGITAGRTNTTEAFGEVHVPILKDVGLFQDLSLSGAARITNVRAKQAETGVIDKDSGNWTYKLGGNWTVNPWLRFRGSFGTSFRAPALFEQFKANETSFVNSRRIDPCVQTALNLERGNINQQIFDNCQAEGIPTNYAGASITATVFSQGGIGVLDPETSRAKTASIILTPNLRAILPDTKLSLAVDYFDIKVKGEISQLGAAAIIRGCYSSEFFPDEPLCNLFGRGMAVDPFAIDNIQDKYVNIAQQVNRGVDFTGLVQQNIGRFGSINFLSQVTWQLKDTFALFAGTETDNNGEIGDPRWVGDFNLTWRAPGGWNLFWGMDVVGKSSNRRDFARANRDDTPGRTCISSEIRGEYCVDVSVPMTAYHSVSVTKELPVLKLEATVGVANLFDTTPPRTSTIGGTGIPSLIGPVVGTSQYDFLGRRAFINVSKSF